MDEPQRPVYTAGMRADEFARRLTATHAAQFGWTAPFHVLLRHLDAIHGSDGRFDRIEATPSGVAIPTLPDPEDFPHSERHGPSAPSGQSPPNAASSLVSEVGTVRRDRPVGQPMSADVVARVERTIGSDVPQITVHDDADADAVARHHHADAVAIGDEVHFRQGRYRPDSAEGFALIVHEAIHVAASHEASAVLPGDDDDVDEEHRALSAEAAVLEDFSTQPRQSTDIETGALPGAITPVTTPSSRHGDRDEYPRRRPWMSLPAQQVTASDGQHLATHPSRQAGITASAAHEVGASVSASSAAPAAITAKAADVDRQFAAPDPVDVDALRRSIIDDVKRLVRDEFERGA